jgi:hypothetical protein
MRPPRHALASLALGLLFIAGCRDREISSYRAPKDPAPAAMPVAAMPANTNDLPPGHPPIGADTAVPAGNTASPPAGAAGANMANTAVPTASGSALTWTAPARWTVKSGSSMRKGSYAVHGPEGDADFAITAFPGDTGGLPANLNRWRGQIGLPALPPDEVTKGLERFESNGLAFIVVDYLGAAGGVSTRLLGGITTHGGNSWFFKLTGPDALVAREKAAYLEFLRTVKAP